VCQSFKHFIVLASDAIKVLTDRLLADHRIGCRTDRHRVPAFGGFIAAADCRDRYLTVVQTTAIYNRYFVVHVSFVKM
jgi:hypothetical protein